MGRQLAKAGSYSSPLEENEGSWKKDLTLAVKGWMELPFERVCYTTD
jgi:hypothetical protein